MKDRWVCVSDNRHSSYEIERELLLAAGFDLRIFNCTTEEEMISQCKDASGILLDMAPMSAHVVEHLARCKVINRYGVGYDNVDVPACTNRHIWVTNVPDYCAEDVSDHTVALLFAVLRGVALRDRLIRQGGWNLHPQDSYRVAGKTLGVLGGGRIARAFIRKMSGFGLEKILVYDPYLSLESIEKMGAQKADLERTLSESDFVSLHMPVTPETKQIICAKTLSLMKPTAILLNASRGGLVDDDALLHALHHHLIAGAGLDTHNREPLGEASPYCRLDNVVLSDHTAYNTLEGVVELKTKSAQNIVDVLTGKTPRYPVNQPVYPKIRQK